MRDLLDPTKRNALGAAAAGSQLPNPSRNQSGRPTSPFAWRNPFYVGARSLVASRQALAARVVKTYGPFQLVNPGQGQAVSTLVLPDGVTQRIIVPNRCTVTRVYCSFSKTVTAGTLTFNLAKNVLSGPGGMVWITPDGTGEENPMVFNFGQPGIQAGWSPNSLYFSNHSTIRPYASANGTNYLASGDFVSTAASTGATFAPFGAGQTFSLYFETTDY